MKQLIILLLASFAFALSVQGQAEILLLKPNGKVLIGDPAQISVVGDYNLYVQNGLLTERVKVALRSESQWSDHAFLNTPSLKEVEEKINKDSHLPGMPSAAQLVKEGYEMQAMDAKLLAQIEWLWQHSIAMKKENEMLKNELEALKEQVARLSEKQ